MGCWPKEDRIAKGTGYRGNQSKTVNGHTCKEWTRTRYYTEAYVAILKFLINN